MRYLVVMFLIFGVIGCDPSGGGHEDHPGGDAHGEHGEHEEHGEASHEEEGHDAHEEGEEGVVHLSPEALRRSGVRVDRATRGGLEDALEIPAEVELDPDRVAHVNALVDGQIQSVEVTLGDEVKEGE